ncbi:hypothetical protein JKG47_20280 [Acidithiobacillus sp. MC6.1]|nr:hypothetical protein [Acidithiobacillus sp. MC6.1]
MSNSVASSLSQKALALAKCRPHRLEAALYLWHEATKLGDTDSSANAEKALDYLSRQPKRAFFHNAADEADWRRRLRCLQAYTHDSDEACADAIAASLKAWRSADTSDLHAWALSVTREGPPDGQVAILAVVSAVAETAEKHDFRWYPVRETEETEDAPEYLEVFDQIDAHA